MPSDTFAAGLVREFRHGDPQRIWCEFMRAYAHLIARVVSCFEREEENRADAFVFVCEQLHRDNCRRLRKFNPHGAATFTTWLHAVVRNLCRDWRRKQFGRSCESEPVVESGDGMAEAPGGRLALNNCLSLDNDGDPIELPDPTPGPEALADARERAAVLARAMSSLSAEQRLALSLRIEEDLTLQEISCLMRLRNAQAADRLIRDAIQTLRFAMHLTPRFHGKTKAASV